MTYLVSVFKQFSRKWSSKYSIHIFLKMKFLLLFTLLITSTFASAQMYVAGDSIITQALVNDVDRKLVFIEYDSLNASFDLSYSAMVQRFGMPVSAYPEVLRREGDPLRQYSYYFDTLKDTPGSTAISCLWLIENRLVFEVIYLINNNSELIPFDALLYNKGSEWLYWE